MAMRSPGPGGGTIGMPTISTGPNKPKGKTLGSGYAEDPDTFGVVGDGAEWVGDKIGEGVDAVGDIYNDLTGVTAAREAANAQLQATREGIAAQKEMYQQGRADLQPWRQAGERGLGQLEKNVMSGAYDVMPTRGQYGSFDSPERAEFLGQRFTQQDFQADPGYQFRLKQGTEALENAAAARGSQLSGNQLKAITDYGQNLASQEYGRAFDRNMQERRFGEGQYLGDRAFNYGNFTGDRAFDYGADQDFFRNKTAATQDQYNRLSNLSNVGQASAAGQAAAANQLGQSLMNANQSMGQTAAQGRMAQYQNQANLFGNLASLGMQGAGMMV